MRPDFLSPIVMAQEMPSGVVSEEHYNPLGFRNPNKTPMILDQIRFWHSDLIATDEILSKLDFKMQLGAIPLTNGFVPAATVFPFFVGPVVVGNPVVGNNLGDKVVTLHLEKPLLIPPQVQMQIAMQGEAGLSLNVHGITLVGRSMSAEFKLPKRMVVPWISGFRAAKTSVVDDNYVTTPNQLGNPNCEPVTISRMIGFDYTNGNAEKDNTIQMTLSTNKALIRDPMPFRLLFPPERGMMQVSAVLEPQEYITCELQAGEGNANGLRNVCVGLIGYREVDTPRGF